MSRGVYTRKLDRSRSWRKATVRSLAQALLTRERIRTTLAKAKEAQRLTEHLITLGKDGTLSARRRALSLLSDPERVKALFSEVAPRFSARPGGYTRIIRDSYRAGDGASLAIVELVELSPEKKEKPKEKGREKIRREIREKPKTKPTEEKKAQPEPKRPKLLTEAPPETPSKPKAAPAPSEKPEEKEKKKGFIEGLRKFFRKGPENP